MLVGVAGRRGFPVNWITTILCIFALSRQLCESACGYKYIHDTDSILLVELNLAVGPTKITVQKVFADIN